MAGNAIGQLFFSENVLLTQENNLDNLNVIIGTIDPFLQNQKNISKNFFQKFAQKWKTVNFLEKIKKSKKKKNSSLKFGNFFFKK